MELSSITVENPAAQSSADLEAPPISTSHNSPLHQQHPPDDDPPRPPTRPGVSFKTQEPRRSSTRASMIRNSLVSHHKSVFDDEDIITTLSGGKSMASQVPGGTLSDRGDDRFETVSNTFFKVRCIARARRPERASVVGIGRWAVVGRAH